MTEGGIFGMGAPLEIKKKKQEFIVERIFVMVQWLRLHTGSREHGFDLWSGNLKILHAHMPCCQKKKKKSPLLEMLQKNYSQPLGCTSI